MHGIQVVQEVQEVQVVLEQLGDGSVDQTYPAALNRELKRPPHKKCSAIVLRLQEK